MNISQCARLSHFEEFGGRRFYVTENGRIGIVMALPPIDFEAGRVREAMRGILGVVRRLPSTHVMRVHSRTSRFEVDDVVHFRRAELSELGGVRQELFVTFEEVSAPMPLWSIFKALKGVVREKNPLERRLTRFTEVVDLEALERLGARCASDEVTKSFFFRPRHAVSTSQLGLDCGDLELAILRVYKQALGEPRFDLLCDLRNLLPVPYEIVVNVRRRDQMQSALALKLTEKSQSTSTESTDVTKLSETWNLRDELSFGGVSLVDVEWLLVLSRTSSQDLRQCVGIATRCLEALGDVYREGRAGAEESLSATLPGGRMHHAFLERDYNLPAFLPLFISGSARPDASAVSARSLPLHRRDGSIFYFDHFDPEYHAANAIVSGRTGDGKGVLINLWVRALLNHPKVELLAADVGDTYGRLCRRVGGREIRYEPNEPSGLDPFEGLEGVTVNKDVVMTLGSFVSTLVLEVDERTLPKSELSDLEQVVGQYAESRLGAKASFSEFAAFAKKADVPRAKLLSRWAQKGVYENAFRARGERQGSQPFTYCNFKSMHTASSPDYGQGCMAAVLTRHTLDGIRNQSLSPSERKHQVFLGDEVKFFIDRLGRAYALKAANNRKFAQGMILVVQSAGWLALPDGNGGLDTSILANSPIRFFFRVEESPKEHPTQFRDRFELTDVELERIEGMAKTNEFHEVFLQDERRSQGRTGRVVRIALTAEEYWEATTSPVDNAKLDEVRKLFPKMGEKEAVACMGYLRRQGVL